MLRIFGAILINLPGCVRHLQAVVFLIQYPFIAAERREEEG
jgi:hypothetical protein